MIIILKLNLPKLICAHSLDSMGIMRLIMYIEEQFGVTLPDSEIDPDNVNSFNALEQWVLQHKS
ncbi:acyl carrier protein [methanotrophic endosymbiont of Bathymodiolus puteoserpentis (Logatchev)]|uniref:acyl carrier protein n=1 Tax=methanotrophic endosymbiont of Bathymodiolus puteoserpentis (Logatchev) TaxID=343235 RepID=UPI001FD91C03|nr:acyl carrier protein [methanotrophic endosymbiont of Bathymodiolus puteoserpentis (Logatchev)]